MIQRLDHALAVYCNPRNLLVMMSRCSPSLFHPVQMFQFRLNQQNPADNTENVNLKCS